MAGHVACTERRTDKEFWCGSLNDNDPLKDLYVVLG